VKYFPIAEKEGCDGQGMCKTERENHLEDLDVDARIV
jgi:hypothetical protein